MLKLNPWDISTLLAMADACEALNFDEAQFVYLKQALDVDPKDAEVNRKCGRALARMGRFDQAIACWHRVEQAKPGDEEAARAIGDLAIEKTISHGGYEGAENSTDVMADKAAKADRRSEATSKLSPVEQLERAIAKKPEDVGLYLELADLHTRDERLKEAEEVLTRALEASGGDVMVRERLEDAQLRTSRQQLTIAEKRAAKEATPEAVELVKRMKAELNCGRNRDLPQPQRALSEQSRPEVRVGAAAEAGGSVRRGDQVLSSRHRRCQTQSANAHGAGRVLSVHQAVQAGHDQLRSRDRGRCAARSRRAEAGSLSGRQTGPGSGRKISCRPRIRKPKTSLERAEKYLNELAGLEFGYKDVPQLLDKISKISHKG